MRLESPEAVFLGGDLLAHGVSLNEAEAFVTGFLQPLLSAARTGAGDVFLILGNDDPRWAEEAFLEGDRLGAWTYLHNRVASWQGYDVMGYACVPPTPFLLKDWERYDVSRYVDPGCVSPEEGRRSVGVDERDVRYGTIQADLDALAGARDLSRAICLFHTPPYATVLDRVAMEARLVDHAPVDVHVGSIAVRRFIERRQPLVTLHGHVHESARLTGGWCAFSGRTVMLGAAHDGPELALVRFDPSRPAEATRELIAGFP